LELEINPRLMQQAPVAVAAIDGSFVFNGAFVLDRARFRDVLRSGRQWRPTADVPDVQF
jgi:hypothetical protein